MQTKLFLPIVAALVSTLMAGSLEAAQDTRCYEMRTYFAPEGKLDALHARFRDHTVKLFEKHGMVNIGYWVPIDNKENKLVYVLAYPSRDAREKSWKAFLADPDWKKAHAESEKDGKLVAKIESIFMTATDYSPAIKPAKAGAERTFELRTYTASPNNLGNLNARFRDHTVKLFEKHGMSNFAYWNLDKDQKDSDKMLIYLLAHKSQDAAMASFKAFGGDADWQKARKASEEKGGGSLTTQGGVQRLFMKPTDYSPTK